MAGLEAIGILFAFLPCASRDLLGRLLRRPQEIVQLLPCLVEGMPNRGRRRCTYLELGNGTGRSLQLVLGT
jgi:hypothetical protein